MVDLPRILIVDDDMVDRITVRRLLKKGRFKAEAVEASTAGEGFNLLLSGGFDLVLLDHRLPDGDGLEFLERVRRMGVLPPAVMLTGQGDEDLAVRAMKAGASDYLVKDDLTHTRLAKTMEALLERRRLGDASARQERTLQQILEGTAMATGDELFELIVDHTATALDADLALLAICNGDQVAEAIAVSLRGTTLERFAFPIEGVPWRGLLMGRDPRTITIDPADAAQVLPVLDAVQAVHGMPLRNEQGRTIGILAALWRDANRVRNDEHIVPIFAARAEAELTRREAQERLRQGLNLQGALIQTAVGFLDEGTVVQRLERGLWPMVTQLGCDRALCYTDDGSHAQLLAVCETGNRTLPALTDSSGQRQALRRWYNSFSMGEAVSGRVRTLPAAEQQLLQQEGVLSVLALPVLNERGLLGYIRFDDCLRGRSWDRWQVDRLRGLGEMLAKVLAGGD